MGPRMFPTNGTGRDEARVSALRARRCLPLNPSARTHRSKAGMVAAQHSSTSSRTNTSSDRTQAQAGDQQASANAAGVQQLFDAWLNAWRTLGAPAAANGNPFAVPGMPAGLPGMPSGWPAGM